MESKDENRNSFSMATRRRNRSSSSKSTKTKNMQKEPLSDISNFNLRATSNLRKLHSSTTSSNPNSVIPKPPITVFVSNSTEVNSDTSVGSSTVNSVARCLHLPATTPTVRDKGKAVAEPLSNLTPETKEDNRKGVSVLSKGILVPAMSLSPQKLKAKTKAVSRDVSPSDEKRAGEKFGALSQICSASNKENGKVRAHASALSCPTLPKTRSKRTEIHRAGDIEPSGSWTDPNGKRKKRRCTQNQNAREASLPSDFINYWREHYKEVDEFELLEEEASYSDLD